MYYELPLDIVEVIPKPATAVKMFLIIHEATHHHKTGKSIHKLGVLKWHKSRLVQY